MSTPASRHTKVSNNGVLTPILQQCVIYAVNPRRQLAETCSLPTEEIASRESRLAEHARRDDWSVLDLMHDGSRSLRSLTCGWLIRRQLR